MQQRTSLLSVAMSAPHEVLPERHASDASSIPVMTGRRSFHYSRKNASSSNSNAAL
jgi:hypothetical protein